MGLRVLGVPPLPPFLPLAQHSGRAPLRAWLHPCRQRLSWATEWIKAYPFTLANRPLIGQGQQPASACAEWRRLGQGGCAVMHLAGRMHTRPGSTARNDSLWASHIHRDSPLARTCPAPHSARSATPLHAPLPSIGTLPTLYSATSSSCLLLASLFKPAFTAVAGTPAPRPVSAAAPLGQGPSAPLCKLGAVKRRRAQATVFRERERSVARPEPRLPCTACSRTSIKLGQQPSQPAMTSSSSPPKAPPTPLAAPATERTRLLRLMLPLSLLLLLTAPPRVAAAKGPDSSQPDLRPDQGGLGTGTLVAVSELLHAPLERAAGQGMRVTCKQPATRFGLQSAG